MKSAARKKILIPFSLLALLALLFVQCTPEKKYSILSFLFDGVPNPAESTVSTPTTGNDSTSPILAIFTKPESYLHKPFAEEKCKSCHDDGFSNSLIKPMPELCYSCHQDFGAKFQNLHGPVASGNCIACHDQHEAKFEKLLKREGQDMCLYCHETKQVFKNKVHEKVGSANCTTCHNPHGGDGRGMLTAGTCFKCHNNFTSKYNYLHGPVASNNCGSCHGMHGSGAPKLLLREGQQLCLSCHNAEEVFKTVVHKKVKTKNCTECHNPHGGEDHFILVESLRPYKTKLTIGTNFNISNDTLTRQKNSTSETNDSSFTQAPIAAAPNVNQSEPIKREVIKNKTIAAPTTKTKSVQTTTSKNEIEIEFNNTSDKHINNGVAQKEVSSETQHPYVTSTMGRTPSPVKNFLLLLKQFVDTYNVNPIPYSPHLLPQPKADSGK